jgi:Ni2+-binding GTPase involved in maturation of urease and hydrogenase
MKFITVSGPPSSGKTSVIIQTLAFLKQRYKVGVVKFDCLSTNDHELYEQNDIKVKVGLSGNLCPDHFYVSNIDECTAWGEKQDFDFLLTESAGLCNRCAPHIREFLAVCVIDNLSGINTPAKIGPMLRFADIVVITKGDIVSQAEREVFSYKVKQVNPRARISFVNGVTGQGAFDLSMFFQQAEDLKDGLYGERLRFSMPAALCSYCLGETRIGEEYQKGNVKKMNF